MKGKPLTFALAQDFIGRKLPDARPVEQREYESYGYTSRMGRSSIMIVCPFCRAHVETFTWSLSGGGKRCTCGALFGSMGAAYQWAEPA